MNTIDLHMHSRFSDDGEFSPARLVEKCVSAGITRMAVTDHNTVQGCEEALEAAKAAGITCLTGIEIDCTLRQVNFHVLGYGIRYTDPAYEEIRLNIARQTKANSYLMLEKIRGLGFDVSEEEMRRVSADCSWEDSWTGEMFGEVLLNRPDYAEHPLLKPYRPGGERSDNPYVNFYWDFCSQGKPCHAPMHYPDMAEIIRIIHATGGQAVLAHPGQNLKGHGELLRPILQLGMDGIECFSSYHSREQSEFYLAQARENHRLITCGSDFHGKTKPAIALGGFERLCDEEEITLGK